MSFRRLVAIAIVGMAATACDDATGITVQDLEGTWNATLYQYVNNANASEQVDLIGQGASFEMTVNATGTASTVFDDGQGGTSSDSGTLNSAGTTLTIAGNAFVAVRNGNSLTLTDVTNEYDFDDNGSDEAATLVIQMTRQ